jgi:hypothetical protein
VQDLNLITPLSSSASMTQIVNSVGTASITHLCLESSPSWMSILEAAAAAGMPLQIIGGGQIGSIE